MGIVGSAVVSVWAYGLVRDTSGILFDRTPRSCDLPGEIQRSVESDGDSHITNLHQSLLQKFSGKGLVPDALTAQPEFLLAVALGAGATVILATLLGFPISTTHGLTGALVGAGIVTGTSSVNFAALGKNFLFPLLLLPILAVIAGAGVYVILRALRLGFGVGYGMCVCLGAAALVL